MHVSRTESLRVRPREAACTPIYKMNAIVERRGPWLTQLARGVSGMMGIGEAVMAISSVAHKRDISALWELDPVAAPPRKVQKQLLGTAEAEQDDGPARHDDERRPVFEVQLQFAMRKHDVERVRSISRQLRALEEEAQREASERARARGELRVGDECFALAKVVEWEWYRARLVNVRARTPQLQIEYLTTLDGDESRLALPVPRINNLPLEHVRVLAPEPSDGPVVPPTTPCVTVPALGEI